jgi:hypothetical protein
MKQKEECHWTTDAGDMISSDQWRRYGEAKRRDLVANDEAEGGTSFHLHKKCRILRYFQLAERVMAQFRDMCEDSESDLEDTYVMGHRLVAFLGKALPKHPEFAFQAVRPLRLRAHQELTWIQGRIEELALKIDEEELNKFICDDFVPDGDSSVSSEETDTAGQWERFSGSVFDPFDLSSDESMPHGTDTDTSSFSQSLDVNPPTQDFRPESDRDILINDARQESLFLPFGEDESISIGQMYSDSDEDGYAAPTSNCLNNRILDTSFLETIAREDVRYESDSEATDSWAQDGDSGVSGASSGTAETCDPARIAYRELLKRIPKSLLHGDAPPPIPVNVPTGGAPRMNLTTDWGSFDFASVRQARHVGSVSL